MFRSILRAAQTQRPQEWGEGRREPSGSTLQLPAAGGSLSGWLHITHSFPRARMSSVRRGAAVLCGLGELGVSSPCQSPSILLLCTRLLQGWRRNPQPSHRLQGELFSLDFIIQCLPTQSFSVAAEILSCRKPAWSQSDLQLPSLQKDKIPAP